jgi:hypothetical protein
MGSNPSEPGATPAAEGSEDTPKDNASSSPPVAHPPDTAEAIASPATVTIPESPSSQPVTPSSITPVTQVSNATATPQVSSPPQLDSANASNANITAQKPNRHLRLHTYRAQLTFGLKPSQKVNVAELFTTWSEASIKLLADFALLPFDSDKQGSVTAVDHIR